MIFVDTAQILTDAIALVRAESTLYDPVMVADATKLKTVDKNLNDRDYVTNNLPLLDFRVKRIVPNDVGGNNYYVEVVVEAEVAVFDLTSLDDAATIRDNLVSGLQRLFQTNPRFSGSLDTTIVGNAEVGTGEDKQSGAFMAGAILDFHFFLYVNG